MNKIKLFSSILILISFLLLIPGLTQPILSFKMETKVDAKVKKFSTTGLEKTRSIVGTVKELLEIKRYLVAFLILLFSILIPVVKIIMLLISLFHKDSSKKKKYFNFVNSIGKWSMADVYAVGIFIVYLSTAGREQTKAFDMRFLGMEIPVKITTIMSSSLESGFYYFTSYCIVSILSLHFIKSSLTKQLASS